MNNTERAPRMTLVQSDGLAFNITHEVIDWTSFPDADTCTLLLDDPASLYVCSDEAGDLREQGWRRFWDTEATARSRHLAHTVVTGSTAPAVDPEPDTVEAIRAMRSDHLLDAPVSGHVDDLELVYAARAYSALCDVIPADRAPWR